MFGRMQTAMREKQRRAWEEKRKQGKRSYILRRGVMRWGGFMFVLTACSDVVVRHEKLDWILLLSLMIGCLLFGYIWGLCIWVLNEGRFGYRSMR
jgi:hypothetical protein